MKHVSKAFTDKVILSDADFGIESGDRIGIIGVNGTGKSSLLKLIAGIEEADDGELVKGRSVVISFLPQTPEFKRDESLYDYVISENLKRRGIVQNDEQRAMLEGEAKIILGRLGFSDPSVHLSTLSGGQRKKASLAACLLTDSDILLLDEPTNHLDNAMSEWLEDELRAYRGAIVMVTHDRYFLDLVCSRIVELDKGKLYTYDTNYEGYLELKNERIESALSTEAKNRNILRKELAWIRRGARARSTKQKARIQRYESLRDNPMTELDSSIEIRAVSSRLGKKTILLHDISMSYGNRHLIKDFNFAFTRDDRVGILGPNGCGKTTLMKIMAGKLAPVSGSVEIGETVKFGYYEQESTQFDPEERVIDCVRDTAEYIRTDEGLVSAEKMCEKFLFSGSLAYQKTGRLSGGERRRLQLLKVLMENPNVLMLDEPTNDLDISTLQILEDYLDSFPGIVITVSHDRYFLDRTCRRLLTFTGDGNISLYNGSYTEFFETHCEGVDGSIRRKDECGDAPARSGKPGAATEGLPGSDESVEGKEAAPRRAFWQAPRKLKFTFSEQREYASIESDIAAAEKRKAELESEMTANAMDYLKLAELQKEKEEIDAKLEHLLERYVYLEDKAEKIKKEDDLR